MNNNRKILIIGAGLGGLAFAQGLIKAGFDVTVFERDESPTSRPQGYRISIRSLGLNALSSLLTPEKKERLASAKVSDVGDGFTCANEKMEPFFSVPQGQDAAVQFLRTELRELLQEGVDVRWNKRLVKFEDYGDHVVGHFEDGTQALGGLLIGCDGGGSDVRELLSSVYGDRAGSIPKIVYNNRVIFGGQIDRIPEWDTLLPLNKSGIVRFLGPNSTYMGVCFSERADRSPTVFWAFSEEIGDQKAPWYPFDQGLESKMRLLEHCKNLITREPWHENLKKLIFATPAEAMLSPWLVRTTQFPERERFPMAPSGRVTLLGDAAHAMPTEKGLGGNNVLEDARLLSSLLSTVSNSADWPALITRYELEMFARAKNAVHESEAAGEYFRHLRSSTEQT